MEFLRIKVFIMLVNTCDGASGLRRNQAILLELAAHAGRRWSGLKKIRDLAREHSIMLLGLGWDIGEVQRLLIACQRFEVDPRARLRFRTCKPSIVSQCPACRAVAGEVFGHD